MNYCEIADLETRYGTKRIGVLLTDPEDEDVTAAAIFGPALEDAQSTIDSYLRSRRRNVPLTTVPDKIKQIACDVVVYYLHRGRDYADIPEWAQKRYDDSLNWLEEFSRGKVDIEVPDDEDDETDDTIITFDEKPVHFTRNSF